MKKEDLHVVTGASGRLGFSLCAELRRRGCAVRALYNVEDEVVERLKNNGCETVFCDVTNLEDIDKAFAGATYVYHLAGIISIESKMNARLEKVNIGGTANVIEGCLKHKVERLIYTGSVHMLEAESGETQTIYETKRFCPEKLFGGYSKSKAEAGNLIIDAVTNRGLDAVLALPAAIVGPYEYNISNFGEMVGQVAEGKLRVYIDGKYNLVDVRDVSSALCDLAYSGEKGEVYTVSGHTISVRDMMNIITSQAGVAKIKRKVPFFIVKIFAKIMEFIALKRKRTPIFTPYSMKVIRDNCNFSHEKLTRLTGYMPRPVEVSLRDQTKFYLENKKAGKRKKNEKVALCRS